MLSCQEALIGFPVVLTLPVLWGNMDSLGHVNNKVYLDWAEACRVEYLIRIGMWRKMAADQIGPILAYQSCDYRRPLHYPDTVSVGATVTKVGNSSLRMIHKIYSEKLGAVVAEADSTLVLYDYQNERSVRIPDEMREAIRSLEAREVVGA